MASASVFTCSLALVVAVTSLSATASIVPCRKPYALLKTDLSDKIVGKCGFVVPNDTVQAVQQQLRQNANHCVDFGSFEGTKPGKPFKDPCKPNVTIDKIELTLSKAPVMIRSLKTTYSDGSVYSHGTPTDEVYTIDLTTYNPRLYIIASVVSYSDVVYRITFLTVDHNFERFCYFGPIGGDGGDWRTELSPVNAFYGSADEGINSLGFYGCIQVPL